MGQVAIPVVIVASSEFILKSSPVRRTLEQRLIDDIKFSLRRGGLECSRVEKDAARFIVFGTDKTEDAAVLCSKIFGVAYSAQAELLTQTSQHEIIQKIEMLAEERLQAGESFAVRCRRSTQSQFSRHEIEVQGGSSVLNAMRNRGVKVDLKQPDVTFYVDLVQSDAYIYYRKLRGPGGLPLSATWKMLAVLDEGPLSILAAEAMMRRGCVVQLFIPISKRVGSLSRDTQMRLGEKVGRLVTRPNYTAFTFDVDPILRHEGDIASSQLALRNVAARFAREKRFKGIVFGNIAGDLSEFSCAYATQNEVPTFYPLLGLEPQDLIELSQLAGIDEVELSHAAFAEMPRGKAEPTNLHVSESQACEIEEVSI